MVSFGHYTEKLNKTDPSSVFIFFARKHTTNKIKKITCTHTHTVLGTSWGG